MKKLIYIPPRFLPEKEHINEKPITTIYKTGNTRYAL